MRFQFEGAQAILFIVAVLATAFVAGYYIGAM
jgi:archaellum component FlaG (FlaF/FlaG flagellin family)